MHSAPDRGEDPKDCVVCRLPFAEGETRWFVRADASWATERGFAHTACVPWDSRPAPWEHLLRELPAELSRMRERVAAGERALRAIRKMRDEWPRDARRRVLIVDELLRRWRRG